MEAASRWNPDGYLAWVREEIPAYDELQDLLVDATRRVHAHRILDLGSGTGETARRLLDLHAHAELHGIDASEQMVEAASQSLAGRPAHFRTGQLEHPLPAGGYDLVTSALAIHHLTAADKRELFRRVAATLSPGGRFVLGDVVVPDDPSDIQIELSEYDRPSPIPDQLDWLQSTGLQPHLCWTDHDLAVIAADRPA
ncbi:MAG: class I SAM-dependent methyltransferase [Thermoleophilaceae bacterium]